MNSRNTVTVDGGLREAGYRIVNRAYLDRYDEAYAENLKRWKEAVYAEAGTDRDPKKLYHAHATIRPELPDIPIMPEDAADAEALICGRNLRK